MSIKIALAGNPNSGKTTLFNALTGSNQFVGNWPGVTVEKKEGKLKGHKDVTIMDLPDIYSLSPYTLEEVVARNYLISDRPDAILNIVDGTNLERNLYLTTQLTELGIPVVMAVNMMDVVDKNGDKIDCDKLGKALGCEVVSISALKGTGIKEAAEKAVNAVKKEKFEAVHSFDDKLEGVLSEISAKLDSSIPEEQKRFFAIKLFERDDKIAMTMSNIPDVSDIIEKCEKELDDDSESIITNARYNYISSIISGCYKKQNQRKLSGSDKIDKVVTNRWLALPIFAVVMFIVYYISVTTVGTWATDWMNDGVFGDGWHLFGIGSSQYEEVSGDYDKAQQNIEAFVDAAQEEQEGNNAASENAVNFYQLKAALGLIDSDEIDNIQADIDGYVEAAEKDGIDTSAVTDILTVTGDEETAEMTPEDEIALTAFLIEAEAKNVTAEIIPEDKHDEGLEPYEVTFEDFASYADPTVLGDIKTASEILALSSDEEISDEDAETLDTLTSAAIEDFTDKAKDVETTVEYEDEEGNVEETADITVSDFSEAVEAEEPDPADYGVWVPGIPSLVESVLEKLGTADWLNSLILDGIVAGVGAVLGFVPQMLVLFLFLAFLESCGYMARIAFIMDRIFRKFGLSGKSFIPMLIGTGCGVPGIMASRTIENERDRRMTIMTTTFIPCGAKLPIIALIAGALFGGAWWVAPSAYFVGIAAIVCSGIILKKTKMFSGDPAPFVMELPAYHMPTVGNLLRSMWERGWSFIKKAGTVILFATVLIWFLQGFGFEEGSFGMVEDMDNSLLAKFGGIIAPLFSPLGWGDWKAAVAAVTGLIAKENVVGTFGILYHFGEVAEDGAEIWGSLANTYAPIAAYSFLVFNLLCAPCFAAIGAIKREMNNAKWTWFAIGYQCIFAYLVALCINQIGSIFTAGQFGIGTVVSFIIVLLFIYLLFRPYKESNTLRVRGKSFTA